jgi:cellulose synthase/poly-beta-1,6-N-acetylglucosamine synthase-like glycosyltransferase
VLISVVRPVKKSSHRGIETDESKQRVSGTSQKNAEKMRRVISFLVPVFNEEKTLMETYLRVALVMNGLPDESEMVFVDDGSRDSSLEIMRDLRRRDPRVRFVSLARNFGHQIAVRTITCMVPSK